MSSRRNKDVAYTAAYNISQYWKKHKDKHKFFVPKVVVNPDTFAIVSDMVDGYPPLAKVQARAR